MSHQMDALLAMNGYLEMTTGGVTQQLTVSSEAKSFSDLGTALKASTQWVYVTFEADDVRIRFDGTAPTAAIGHLRKKDTEAIWSRKLFEDAQFIHVTTDATLTITEMVSRKV